MRNIMRVFVLLFLFITFNTFSFCGSIDDSKIIFLHHSTGQQIWAGGVEDWFYNYNNKNSTNYKIEQREFPKDSPYGWENYPYDYYNIWVRNAGNKEYKQEPTLEILTKEYNVIVFKHCFPVSDIEEDYGQPDINSSDKRIENYKLQYDALKKKMREFPDVKFIVWTGAALTKENTNPESAERAGKFFTWVKNEWDEKGDNIFVWDFYSIETEGGLYLKNKYAQDPYDSHPNEVFSKRVAPMLCEKIIEVIKK